MSDAENELLTVVVPDDADADLGPLDYWLDNLRRGRCRLPVLTAPVLKELIMGWVHSDPLGDTVCNRCGLEYARRRRESAGLEQNPVFAACPHCGAPVADSESPYRTANKPLPWKQLDGWVGP